MTTDEDYEELAARLEYMEHLPRAEAEKRARKHLDEVRSKGESK